MALGTPNWVSVDLQLGFPQPGTVDSGRSVNGSTVSSIAVGTVAKFRDSSTTTGLGVGEFIFLPGVASTVAGDVVTFTISDAANGAATTVRWDGTAGTGLPLAIATAATVASTWGWYQIGGTAIVNCAAAVASGAKAFYGGTTAQLDDAQVNGKQVLGAIFSSADDSGSPRKAALTIDRPHSQGQIV